MLAVSAFQFSQSNKEVIAYLYIIKQSQISSYSQATFIREKHLIKNNALEEISIIQPLLGCTPDLEQSRSSVLGRANADSFFPQLFCCGME
jgi:hypothetical protein